MYPSDKRKEYKELIRILSILYTNIEDIYSTLNYIESTTDYFKDIDKSTYMLICKGVVIDTMLPYDPLPDQFPEDVLERIKNFKL
ncbi:MAG TPA: hypothetical protein V6C58_10190 [Allocoleopsis sp.]